MPIPTMSPGFIEPGTSSSSVSSQMIGSPNGLGVAAARTYSQRGVITAVPKAISLGLTRWTRSPEGTAALVTDDVRTWSWGSEATFLRLFMLPRLPRFVEKYLNQSLGKSLGAP